MALTNVQNAFLKLQLKNNPEFIAEYFPNIIDEGPTSQYETNVPYETPGSRINIRDLPFEYEEKWSPGVGTPIFDIANIAAQERSYKDELIAKGQTQAINMNPDILASYGTATSSPRNEMVNTPEWFKKIGEAFNFETGPTVDQATLNEVIRHILTHETGHGVSRLKPYLSDTKKAETLDFLEFLTPNIKQSKRIRERYDMTKLTDEDISHGINRLREKKRLYYHTQEELFNRMKDIERFKRKYPDSYEDHPLWDLYLNRAKKKFAELTGEDWKEKQFDAYKEKIKPFVDKYFEKVEKKGSGIPDINIEKEEIGMPAHLTIDRQQLPMTPDRTMPLPGPRPSPQSPARPRSPARPQSPARPGGMRGVAGLLGE
jgi:hypothetical protein